MGRERARGGFNGFLGSQSSHNRQYSDDRDEPADPDDNARDDIVEGGVGAKAGKRAAVVIGRLAKTVEDFRQAVGAGIFYARQARRNHDGQGGWYQTRGVGMRTPMTAQVATHASSF